MLTLTNFGYVKRQKADAYRTQRRGGRGIIRHEHAGRRTWPQRCSSSIQPRLCDVLHQHLGRVYRLKCYEMPEGSSTSKGMNIANLLPIAAGGKGHRP